MKRVYYDQFPEGVAFRFLNRPPSTTEFPPRKLGRKIEHSHVGRFFRGRATSGVTRFLLLLRRIHSRYLPFPTSLTFAAQSSPIRNNFLPSGQSCNLLWYLQPSLLSFFHEAKKERDALLAREGNEDAITWGNIRVYFISQNLFRKENPIYLFISFFLLQEKRQKLFNPSK